MIIKQGKDIDIKRFKSGMLSSEKLKQLVLEYKRVSKLIMEDPLKVRIELCPVCGSDIFSKNSAVIHGIPFGLCGKCSSYFSEFQMPSRELEKYYNSSGNYHQTSYIDKDLYRYRAEEVSSPKIDFISDFVRTKRKRWLDVGSGIGDVIYNLKNRGIDAVGLEISEDAVDFSRKVFNVELENRSLEDALEYYGEGYFDIVSFFGVLEHIPDPADKIEKAMRLISPGGVLALEVPNAESISIKGDIFFSETVVRQMVPFLHLTIFSAKGLEMISDKYSLEKAGLWYMGLDFYNFLLHVGSLCPGFFESEICGNMLDMNNEMQAVIDSRNMSDQMLMVMVKPF